MRLHGSLTKNEKAISPVLVVLLMIAVAVTASLVTYTWVLGYVNTTTARAEHAIQIQSIAHNAPDETSTTVYVQNAGQGTVKISDAYVNGLKVAMIIVASEGVTAEGIVDEGCTAIIILDADPTAGTNVKIKVTCIDGTATETTVTAE